MNINTISKIFASYEPKKIKQVSQFVDKKKYHSLLNSYSKYYHDRYSFVAATCPVELLPFGDIKKAMDENTEDAVGVFSKVQINGLNCLVINVGKRQFYQDLDSESERGAHFTFTKSGDIEEVECIKYRFSTSSMYGEVNFFISEKKSEFNGMPKLITFVGDKVKSIEFPEDSKNQIREIWAPNGKLEVVRFFTTNNQKLYEIKFDEQESVQGVKWSERDEYEQRFVSKSISIYYVDDNDQRKFAVYTQETKLTEAYSEFEFSRLFPYEYSFFAHQ